jgi:hypothetical protein
LIRFRCDCVVVNPIAEVRFGAHLGHKSDIQGYRLCANFSRTHPQRNSDLFAVGIPMKLFPDPPIAEL